MNWNISLTKEEMEYQQRQIQDLMSNPLVIQFLNENKLDSSFLKKNLSDFQMWIEDEKKCKNCPGMSYCSHNQKGYIKSLYMDETGYLCDVMKPCVYKQKENDRLKHRKNISSSSHMSRQDLLIDFASINLMGELKEYINVVLTVKNNIDEPKGIYLYGQPGVGKSYLMKALANHYAKSQKKVCFIHVPSVIQDIKNNFYDSEYQRNIMREIQKSEILILDDIGSEAISEWQRDNIIYTILAYRDDNKLKTYFTSNYTLDELEIRYTNKDTVNGKVPSNRIKNRIQSLAKQISLKGKSRR